jgi:hypothetical protein
METVARSRNSLFRSLGVLLEDEGQLNAWKEKTVQSVYNDWENFRFTFFLFALTPFRIMCGSVLIQRKITNFTWEKMEYVARMMSVSEIYKSVCTYFVSEDQSLKCRLLDLVRLWLKGISNGHCDAPLPIGERVRLGIFDEFYFSWVSIDESISSRQEQLHYSS